MPETEWKTIGILNLNGVIIDFLADKNVYLIGCQFEKCLVAHTYITILSVMK